MLPNEPSYSNDTLVTQMMEDALEEYGSSHDERWLVSYADMMTLLFGLFVMLFSLAMETQGRPDQVLSDLPNTSQRQPNSNEVEQWKAYAEKLKAYAESLKKKYEELLKRSSGANISQMELDKLKADNEKLRKRIQELLSIIEGLKTQQGLDLPKLLAELEALRDKLSDYEALKKRLAELEALQSRTADYDDLKKRLVELESQLQNAAAAEQTIAQLNNKIKTLEETIREGLESKKNSSFFLINLQWDSEKHDLDLIVTDPFGNQYDFENRMHKNKAGKLVVDSRSGPGVELWKSLEFTPGKYLVQVKFYNSYGNSKPARTRLLALSNVGEFTLLERDLEFAKDKLLKFELDVFPNGNIHFKPL
jgi:flagellar motor protein MotB